ncbi:MAG TPA: hypothetical protein PKC49_13565 [Phycisphaerae bacterium]|nr:hypothetical protein [Phycisphaerae bacterium]
MRARRRPWFSLGLGLCAIGVSAGLGSAAWSSAAAREAEFRRAAEDIRETIAGGNWVLAERMIEEAARRHAQRRDAVSRLHEQLLSARVGVLESQADAHVAESNWSGVRRITDQIRALGPPEAQLRGVEARLARRTVARLDGLRAGFEGHLAARSWAAAAAAAEEMQRAVAESGLPVAAQDVGGDLLARVQQVRDADWRAAAQAFSQHLEAWRLDDAGDVLRAAAAVHAESSALRAAERQLAGRIDALTQLDRMRRDARTSDDIAAIERQAKALKLPERLWRTYTSPNQRPGPPVCRSCAGNGLQTCLHCEGAGKLNRDIQCPSTACKGRGRYQCPNCRGTSNARCTTCAGKGTVRRQTGTRTVGALVWPVFADVDCSACERGRKRCLTCSNGTFTCKRCEGSGVIQSTGPCRACDSRGSVACVTCSGASPPPRAANP